MRTYVRADIDAARALWRDFGHEWCEFRFEAADRGLLYPPSGTKWDSWDDDEPSQRAILIRAIRETPDALHRAIAQSRSWSEVIRILLRERDAKAAAIVDPPVPRVRRRRGLPTATRELMREWTRT